MLDMQGKIVLVTGGSRGIGAAAASLFARAGAKGIVVHFHQNREAAIKIATEIEKLGVRTLICGADMASSKEVTTLFARTIEVFGRVDVVVANAGIWPPDDCPLAEMEEEQWERTRRVNLDGVYFVCREAARIMIRQGSGSIITVSSTAGQRGEVGHADYAASKGGVISLTKSLASELGPAGIRVNCVAPGWVDTEMAEKALHADQNEWERIISAIPLRRVATAEDVSGAIIFLASNLARHITGEILNVNGGSVLCG